MQQSEQPKAGANSALHDLKLESRCISVVVGRAHYALHLDEVQEVIGLRPLTRVFHAPPAMAGITSLRGDVLPVLDLGVLLGGEAAGRGADGRVVVVRDTQKRRAGLLVDALAGLREIPEAGLTELPNTLSPSVRALSEGVIPSAPPCVVLGATRVLSALSTLPGLGSVPETGTGG